MVTARAGRAPRPRRLGPRPLAFYLQLAAATQDPERSERFLAGLRAYWSHPFRRVAKQQPCLWAEGSARLFDHGGSGPPVLIVPSLINRAYILDLLPDRSLTTYLGAAGFRTLLLDWGVPDGAELGLTLGEQIHSRAGAALDAATACTGERPMVIGYCLGGLIAAGLAAARPGELAGLALLATPWDFHAGGPRVRPSPALAPQLSATIATLGYAPVDLLQAFFASLDPTGVLAKYSRFAGLPPDDPRARSFVAVEDWLNDGVPLAGPIAQECLLDWYGRNLPAVGRWAPGGVAVAPESLDLPVLVAVPHRDRIVPAASAEAIVPRLPQPTLVRPAAGHVSMIVGEAAERELWQPLVKWLRRIAPRRPGMRVPAASATP
jgi:polyhydroxyalkanoate synthase